MKLKTFVTTSLALFFLGLGVSANIAHARVPCSTCDIMWDKCESLTGAAATACYAKARICYSNCTI